MKLIRLDRLLANAGLGTRNEVKELIKKGRIKVNGVTVCKGDQKVFQEKDRIVADGVEISGSEFEYYMLHKPSGCVTATVDNHDKTVMDYLPSQRKKGLFPVGRLDKDTEGLLLITNDGVLAHQLLSPKKQVEKTYFVRFRGRISPQDLLLFEQGLDIGDPKPTLPARLKFLKESDCSEAEIIISEGRFHQVKRMFEAVGCEVIYLKHLSMGTLTLDETLGKGDFRSLTDKELERIRGIVC